MNVLVKSPNTIVMRGIILPCAQAARTPKMISNLSLMSPNRNWKDETDLGFSEILSNIQIELIFLTCLRVWQLWKVNFVVMFTNMTYIYLTGVVICKGTKLLFLWQQILHFNNNKYAVGQVIPKLYQKCISIKTGSWLQSCKMTGRKWACFVCTWKLVHVFCQVQSHLEFS